MSLKFYEKKEIWKSFKQINKENILEHKQTYLKQDLLKNKKQFNNI